MIFGCQNMPDRGSAIPLKPNLILKHRGIVFSVLGKLQLLKCGIMFAGRIRKCMHPSKLEDEVARRYNLISAE